MLKKCLLCLTLTLLLAVTGFAQENNRIAIGFYNLENLFDTIDDPLTNDAEFLPDGANQWTAKSSPICRRLFRWWPKSMATVW